MRHPRQRPPERRHGRHLA